MWVHMLNEGRRDDRDPRQRPQGGTRVDALPVERPDERCPAVRGQQTADRAHTDPPGEFLSERLQADCERFLRDTRRMSEARKTMTTGHANMHFR